MALRHRRAPVLHQGRRGAGPVARDSGLRGLPGASPPEPHLLRRQVLRLPPEHTQRPVEPRAGGGRPVCRFVRLGPAAAARGPEFLRGVHGGAVRVAPVPNVLQDLHREGVGRSRHRDPGRLGGPAHQEPEPAAGRHQRAAAAAAAHVDHEPHRLLRVPPARAGDDVGALRRPRPGPRCARAPRAPGRRRSPPRRQSRVGGGPHRRRRCGDRVQQRDLLHAAAVAGEVDGPGAAARGARGRGRPQLPGLP